MDSQGLPLGFSNWGENYRTQGVLALGQHIRGAKPGGGTVINSGTSYATPVVSGIAALLMSIQLKTGQEPSGASVRSAILSSAVGCNDEPISDCRRLLAGRLNVKGATDLVNGGRNVNDSDNSEATVESHAIEDNDVQASNMPKPLPAVVAASAADAEPSNKGDASETPPLVLDTTSNKSAAGRCHGIRLQPWACNRCKLWVRRETRLHRWVYALGQLGYDFISEARRDSIEQQMGGNPGAPDQLLAYLEANPWDAASIIWTLNFDTTPIYAIQPQR